MPLSMARPWKHPKTGVYWLRKGVPEALRALVGKREEKRSLKTRDPDEARQRHAQALSEVEAQWAHLRSGPRQLTQKEAHALASVHYDAIVAHFADNPSQQTFWRTDLGDALFALPKIPPGASVIDWTFSDPDWPQKGAMRDWCQAEAEALLQKPRSMD